jgi:hypothetical protein
VAPESFCALEGHERRYKAQRIQGGELMPLTDGLDAVAKVRELNPDVIPKDID